MINLVILKWKSSSSDLFYESSVKPRVGSLVLLVHDFADHWLELAKMARYVQYQVKSYLINDGN